MENWSGAYEKVYVSKNQKKRQQQGQELALVSLADLDGFFKAGKRAEAKGQNYVPPQVCPSRVVAWVRRMVIHLTMLAGVGKLQLSLEGLMGPSNPPNLSTTCLSKT